MTFIRNAWYAAAWADEIGQEPLARRILDEPVVLFRAENGAIGALRDVCPHRAVPLSMGTVEGDRIRCPYHALEFDTGGICRHNPHVKGQPDRIKVQSYQILERYGMIWLWFGDPEKADPAALTHYEVLEQNSGYKAVTGYLNVKASYLLVIDNLMDLAHAEFIHTQTVGSPGASKVEQAEVLTGLRGEGTITVKTLWPDLPPNAVNRPIWTHSEHVDAWQEMTWHKPSHMFLNLGIMAPGEPREAGIHTPSAHILTPETATSTHYFWAFTRTFEKENPAVCDSIRTVINQAFGGEDAPILEAAQRALIETGGDLLNFSVGDAGSAHVRREIDRIIKQQEAESTPAER